MPKTYQGVRDINETAVVMVNGEILSPEPSQRLMNHSPTGFEWSYGGSGPAQLALAILFDCTNDAEKSLRYHQDFKWRVVAGFEMQGWTMTEEKVMQVLSEIIEDRKVQGEGHSNA